MRIVFGKSSMYSRNAPPFIARGSPIRSKPVFVSHPSPLKPLPPCSAGTAGSAPASASGKTGYAFLSIDTAGRFGAGGAGADEPCGGGAPPPPHAAGQTTTAARQPKSQD